MSEGSRETALTVGIFVGGRGARMGGAAKGLLAGPGTSETLLARLLRIVPQAAPGAAVVLVGEHAAYATLGVDQIADDPPGVGPLGGLRALLLHAERQGSVAAIALAVDLPFVTEPLLRRLRQEAPNAAALAPRIEGRWEPLCTRYEPAACLAVLDGEGFFGRASLARGAARALGPRMLLEALGTRASALLLEPREVTELTDWDSPEDIERTREARNEMWVRER